MKTASAVGPSEWVRTIDLRLMRAALWPTELHRDINGEIGARLSPSPSIGLYHGGTGDSKGT